MPRRAVIIIAASIVVPIVLYVGLDWMIESDEEKVEAIIERMIDAIETEDVDALLASVPETYLHDGVSYADLRTLCERYFDAYGKTTLYTRDISPHVTGNTAAVNVSVFWTSERHNVYTGGAGTRWQLTFIKRRKEWEVNQITPLTFGRYDVRGWSRIAGSLGYQPTGR